MGMVSAGKCSIWFKPRENKYLLLISCMDHYLDAMMLEARRYGIITRDVERQYDFGLYLESFFDPEEMAGYLREYVDSL